MAEIKKTANKVRGKLKGYYWHVGTKDIYCLMEIGFKHLKIS